VISQAIRPLSCTTPSLSMNSSLRNTRRIARRSSLMTCTRPPGRQTWNLEKQT
jgi:hypothetical protein